MIVSKCFSSTRYGAETLSADVYYDLRLSRYVANLLGGEFANEWGWGESVDGALFSLRIRVMQLRGLRDSASRELVR